MNQRTIKLIGLLLAIALLMTATGCGQKPAEANTPTPLPDGITPAPTMQPTVEPTATPDPMAIFNIWNRDLEKDVYHILLIGTDKDSPESYGSTWGHNDTTMILQVDIKNNTMKLVSFVRDVYLEVPGKGSRKLADANMYGGPNLVKKTIEHNFKVPIDYYAKVSFITFEHLVKIIGNVQIEVQEMEVAHLHSVESSVSMEGEQITSHGVVDSAGTHDADPYIALSYVRNRHDDYIDPETGKTIPANYGRNARQREFIKSAWNKVKSQEVFALPAAAAAAQIYVDTDMDLSTIITMLKMLMEKDTQIEDMNIPNHDEAMQKWVDKETGNVYSNDELKALYQEQKELYETPEPTPAPGETPAPTEEKEEKEPFPEYKAWRRENKFSSIVTCNISKRTRVLHEFFGIDD